MVSDIYFDSDDGLRSIIGPGTGGVTRNKLQRRQQNTTHARTTFSPDQDLHDCDISDGKLIEGNPRLIMLCPGSRR